jgi:cytochrome c-type biogenesis protein CcmF
VRRNRRRWGGYIVHVGVVVMFVGFAGAAFDTEVRQALDPGESISVRSAFGHTYNLRYEGLSSQADGHMRQWIALLSVDRDGRPLGTMSTERRFYFAQGQPVTEVGIRSTALEDLYIILASLDERVGMGNDPDFQRATFQVMVNPLVPWIWYGGLILAFGTLIGLWPGAGVPRVPLEAGGGGSAAGGRSDPGPGSDPEGDPEEAEDDPAPVPAGVS